jgi:hypothetical protein
VSRDSWIHDDVSRHFGSLVIKPSCKQCSSVDPEKIRVGQPKDRRLTIPTDVLIKLYPEGRAIYKSYLRWLAEPDE